MKHVAAGCLLALFPYLTLAAPPPWRLDPTFGTDAGGSVIDFDQGGGNKDVGRIIVKDEQDRLYLIGLVANGTGNCLGLARLLPDGQIDSEHYGDGGYFCHEVFVDAASELRPTDALVQPDGRLIVAGWNNLSGWPVICAFDTSGQLDNTGFGEQDVPGCTTLSNLIVDPSPPSGSPDAGLKAVSIVQHDDRLQLAITQWDSAGTIRIARLKATTGEIIPYGQDETVPIDLDAGAKVSDIRMEPNGMLFITGAVLTDATWDAFLVAVNAETGTPDDSFNDGKPVVFGTDGFDVPTSLTFAQDGSIVVGGASSTPAGMRPMVGVVLPSGQFSALFNDGHPATYDLCVFYVGNCNMYATAIETLADGDILFGGYMNQDAHVRPFTMRLTSGGMPDPGWGPNAFGQAGFAAIPADNPAYVNDMVMQRGRPVLAGWLDNDGPAAEDFVAIALSDGSLFRDGLETTP